MNKKLVTAGLAAGLLAGTGAGLVLQMSGSAGAASSISATSTPVGASDSPTETADQSARLQEVLKPLVDARTLTQAQADSVVETLVAAGPMGGGRGHHRRGPGLEVVATTLGMTEAEIRDAISNGQTLAQLAEAKGSSAQALIDAIIAEHKAHLDEEVAAGEHTQAEADAKLAEATTRVTDFVNNTHAPETMGPGGHGPGDHGPGDHGPRGDSPGGDDDAPTDGAAPTPSP